jgi:hypothetical protein
MYLKEHNVAKTSNTVREKKITALSRTQMLCMVDKVGYSLKERQHKGRQLSKYLSAQLNDNLFSAARVVNSSKPIGLSTCSHCALNALSVAPSSSSCQRQVAVTRHTLLAIVSQQEWYI